MISSVVAKGSRLKADGPNELARSGQRTPFRIVFEVLREPMLALLLGGGVLYLLLGSPDEALMLGVTLVLPFAQRMFRFGPLHPDDLAVTVMAGLATIVILEFLKPHWQKRLMS